MNKTTKEIFPGITEVSDEWGYSIFKDSRKAKSSKKYKQMLKDLEKAQELLDKAYEIVASVKERGIYSDGKSDLMTVEDLLSKSTDPEYVLDSILGLR